MEINIFSYIKSKKRKNKMEKYNNILNFYKEYIKLEQIIRKGWLMRNVPAERLESVADHTLQLIMLSNIIVKELKLKIDMTKLTEMILIHDLGEIIIGDISEVEEDRKNKKSKESAAVKSVLNNLSDEHANYYYLLWSEMENQDSELARFALLIDKIDAVIKSGIYEEQYKLEGLFEEFSTWQKQKGTFDNSELEDFFTFIIAKFGNSNSCTN